jgi:hypothetical protein
MEEREFARAAGRYYAAAVVFGVMALGALGITVNGILNDPVLAVVGVPVLPSMAAFAYGFWSLARDPLPGLIILDQGLYDNAFLFPAGAVAWSDIAACALRVKEMPAAGVDRTRPTNRSLLITLRDPPAFFAALPLPTRLGRTLTLFALRKSITIPDGFLAADLDEVHRAIIDRLERRPPLQ